MRSQICVMWIFIGLATSTKHFRNPGTRETVRFTKIGARNMRHPFNRRHKNDERGPYEHVCCLF